MKKRKFNARAMKRFTTEPKVVHEAKPIDLITQYNRMRSIATDIYNSDFFMIASKAEQKKIEASIACISATMISMIGMEAIKNSHDSLPDDSGNGNDRSWDSLPDDSGDYTDTDKASHDAIKKMMNIAYGETKSDAVKKAAARQVLNSVYGAPSSIVARNRKILSELGTKSPMQIMHECLAHIDNEHDDDSDGDKVKNFEVNLGNFIDGPFYSDQYRALGIQYGFDIEPTLKQIEKLASYYYIQMINLVDVVDSQDEITADKYTLEPGSVFFITNKKDSSKSPVFILVYMQPYTKTRSFDISRFSIEIAPAKVEESTKTNYVELIDPDFYFHIGRANPNNAIDLNATLDKIKDEARTCGIRSITFAGTLEYGLDIYDGKYSLKPGSLFYINDGPNMTNFLLVTEVGDTQDAPRVQFIESIMKPKDEKLTNLEDLEESTKSHMRISPMQIMVEVPSDDDSDEDADDVDFGNFADGPFYSDWYRHICQLNGFNIDETLKRIVKSASDYTISKLNLVGVVSDKYDIRLDVNYYPKIGDVFFVTNKENDKDPVFVLICAKSHIESFNIDKVSVEIKPVELEESTKTNYIDFVNSDAYFNIGKVHLNPNIIIDLDATLEKIKDEARTHGIDTITFVDTIKNVLDIYAEGKYTLETGSLFYVNNDGPNLKHFILVTRGGDIPGKILARSIDPVRKLEESTKSDDIEFINSDAYFNIGEVHLSPNTVIDLNATLEKIKDEAREYGIDTITFVDTIGNSLDIYTKGKYTLEPGSLFCHRGNGWLNFMLTVKDKGTPNTVRFIWPVEKPEENTSLDDIEFIGSDAYYKIDKGYQNSNLVIDLGATLIKIKENAKEKGIKTITFVDTVKEHGDIYTKGKYSLEPGSLFFIKEGYPRFVLFNDTPTTFYYIDPVVVFKTDDSTEDSSDSEEDDSHDVVDGEVKFEYTPYESRYINDLATSSFMAKDDIEFVGSDAYYKIDKAYSKSTIIDLDATLAMIKERARAKNIKTITFVGIIKGHHEAYYKGNNSQVGSLYYLKNDERPMFILITGNMDYVNLPMHEDIDPVVIKKDDPEGESDSVKE